MTWKAIKQAIRELGVTDTTEIGFIDIDFSSAIPSELCITERDGEVGITEKENVKADTLPAVVEHTPVFISDDCYLRTPSMIREEEDERVRRLLFGHKS
jgi:hypothetical protein